MKTYGGYLAGQIFITHIIFGIVEGFIDIKNNGKRGIFPALFSVLGHGAFGYITITIYTLTGIFFYGLLAGIFTHIVYNTLIVGVVNNLNNRS